MPQTRSVRHSMAVLVFLAAGSAQAQTTTTTTEGLTLVDTLNRLTSPVAGGAVGDALAFATALEVATTPLGISSAGFVYKLDPTTGLRVRTATTFGPAFSERVLTSGAGKVSFGANLTVSTFDRLGSFNLSRMTLSRADAAASTVARDGLASLVLSAQTTVLYGTLGATDRLDVSVAVPLVKVNVEGISWVQNRAGDVLLRTEGAGISSGLGDVAASAKFRLLRFGEGEPDPGGVALMASVRLPTGDRENLRGLGVTRTQAAVAVSSGRGRFRPHANAGYEMWSKAIAVAADPSANRNILVRNQAHYTAGFELEAAPKVTLNIDLLGRHILGGGRVAREERTPPPNSAGVNTFTVATVTTDRIRKLVLAPGVKWNLKGNVLLSLNALIPLKDNGLSDRFTPVVGLDWTF
jgi:hypothetical protein